jgi:hypothetical protein
MLDTFSPDVVSSNTLHLRMILIHSFSRLLQPFNQNSEQLISFIYNPPSYLVRSIPQPSF